MNKKRFAYFSLTIIITVNITTVQTEKTIFPKHDKPLLLPYKENLKMLDLPGMSVASGSVHAAKSVNDTFYNTECPEQSSMTFQGKTTQIKHDYILEDPE